MILIFQSSLHATKIGDRLNVVHILQHNLKDVEGHTVLCTYTKPENILRAQLAFNRFYDRNLTFTNIYTDFAISYKLDHNIHTLIFDHKNIKNLDLATFSAFLQIQYSNVVKFYKELQKQYSNKYQELIPEYDFSETKIDPHEKLKTAFNIVLNANYNNLTRIRNRTFVKG